MSGPKRRTAAALPPKFLILVCLAVTGGLARTAGAAEPSSAGPATPAGAAAADSASLPPYSLRTEWTLDRDALEAAGIRRPSRLAYDSDGNLHVLDSETRRVVKLDPRGCVLFEVGGYGQDETSFELPVDIAVDRDQSLLVLDRGRGALIAFDRSGHFLGQKLFQGDAAEESRGAGARILLDRFGKLWLLSAQARDLVPLDDRLSPARATRYLVPEDSVRAPLAAASAPGGDLWIYDAGRGALRRFDASGRLTATLHLNPQAARVSVSDLAVDRAGYVYAADVTGQRVLVMGPDGAPVLTRQLGGERVTWRPSALALGPRGLVALADPERGEIQVLSAERVSRP